MPTPVPVPSKAAIQALRGLVLGTTCTLALVTEDRRRRINTARRALSNGERLKSSAQYHSSAAVDLITSKEEDVFLLESWPFPRRHPVEPDNSSSRASDGPGCAPPAVHIQESGRETTRAPKPTWGGRPKTAIPEKLKQKQAFGHPKKRREVAEVRCLHKLAAEITALIESGRPQRLGDAAALLKRTVELPAPESETGQGELLEVTARLSKACQVAKRMEDALKVLRAVLRLGPLDEEVYFAHDPLPIVEDTLLRDKYGLTPSRQYSVAVDLYIPRLNGNPSLRGPEMLKTAQRLIEAGVDAGRYTLVSQILFERVNWYLEEPGACEFLRHVFHRLHQKSMFEAVVRFFVSCSQYHRHLMADRNEYYGVCDLVVKCVSEANGYRIAEVIDCLRTHQPADVYMRVAWLSELLYLHWKKEGKYNETLKLFLALRETGISDLVAYPDGVYRTIIQIALEAGESSAAQDHFDDLIKHHRESKNNVRILGLFALARAKAGDWVAVDSFIRRMYPAGRAVPTHGTDVLVPILKEYRECHTIEETEAFVKFALNDLKVPLTKYMVTLIANEYGAARDVKSFLAWIKYCSGASFEMDAAFSNAILTSCRNHWKFDFADLRRVYLVLQGFGAAFTDEVTDRIMIGAALFTRASFRKVSLALALRSRRVPRKTLPRGRFDPAKVATTMATWIDVGRPDKAIRTYKFMTASGMPHCPNCLRLYSVAAMKLGTGNLDEVLRTLQGVKKKGIDTNEAIVALFTADLESVDRNLGGRHVQTHAHNVLQGLEKYGLGMASPVLNKAAAEFIKTRDYERAAYLALMAAEVEGKAPGFNATNFNLLLEIYSTTKQWERLSKLVEAATNFGWWSRMAGRHANVLKRVKYLVRVERKRPSGGGGPALEYLELALHNITLHRDQLRKEQAEVQKGVLNIIASAAEDSGCDVREPDTEQAPVDQLTATEFS
ncbi:hypothetical protein RB595_001636 [Gaeumannomyces hyphopodioides]